MIGIDDWDFVISCQCRKYDHLQKKRDPLATQTKTFYPAGLNEKGEYLY